MPIYLDMSEEDYRADAGISQSLLKLLKTDGGPARLKYGDPQGHTRPQKFGTLFHYAMLQPDKFERRYAPTDLERTGTKAWIEAEQMATGRELVKRLDYEKAMRMRDALLRWSPVARELLTSGKVAVEQPFFWTDPETVARCKGLADGVNHDYQVLFDLKSAEDASLQGFRWAARKWGYALQAAWYLDGWPLADGWDPQEFVIFAVEKDPPYLSASYAFDPADIAAARAELATLLNRYVTCQASGIWPGYEPSLQTLSLT